MAYNGQMNNAKGEVFSGLSVDALPIRMASQVDSKCMTVAGATRVMLMPEHD